MNSGSCRGPRRVGLAPAPGVDLAVGIRRVGCLRGVAWRPAEGVFGPPLAKGTLVVGGPDRLGTGWRPTGIVERGSVRGKAVPTPPGLRGSEGRAGGPMS